MVVAGNPINRLEDLDIVARVNVDVTVAVAGAVRLLVGVAVGLGGKSSAGVTVSVGVDVVVAVPHPLRSRVSTVTAINSRYTMELPFFEILFATGGLAPLYISSQAPLLEYRTNLPANQKRQQMQSAAIGWKPTATAREARAAGFPATISRSFATNGARRLVFCA